jgi:hypothetical protein
MNHAAIKIGRVYIIFCRIQNEHFKLGISLVLGYGEGYDGLYFYGGKRGMAIVLYMSPKTAKIKERKME